jgi:hypothetical protein
MDMKRKEKFEINEMFGAQPDKDRFFAGCIKRLKDDNGNPFVFSRIVMPDGLLYSSASEQYELSKNLDEMCIMILDKGLHSNAGVNTKIFGMVFYLN